MLLSDGTFNTESRGLKHYLQLTMTYADKKNLPTNDVK